MTPQDVLQKHFGFPTFRGPQLEIIEHVLKGDHALVIMPTGMGKSLCYQIPALVVAAQTVATTPRPLTLVISPLIALMKDQVDGLVDRGIDAAFINSSLKKGQREQRYQAVAAGEYDLLYVTPERFRKPEFVEVLSQRNVTLLAVDEAHCISEWGHDFRPDYTRLREFRDIAGQPTTIALTATATPDVQQDILRQLGLEPNEMQLFHEGIDRPNLHLDVIDVWEEDEKLQQILRLHENRPGSGVVYFTLIKTLMRFSEILDEWRLPHLVYHGKLERDQRRAVQEQFMSEASHLVLATNAFGMGIDKEDIRLVVHADVPGSMESYYQEIGRAGRDGLDADCVLLYDQRDLATQMEFMTASNPSGQYYERVYDYLLHDEEKLFAFGLEWLREELHPKKKHDHRIDTALSMLDRYGVIEGTIEPFTLKVVAPLPEALQNQGLLDQKLLRDQQKLYTLVQYVKCEGDRKRFIHEYFGLPYHGDDEER